MTALVDHVAHQARMDAPTEKGGKFSVRENLAQRLRRLVDQRGPSHPTTLAAQADLDGPPPPAALAYLADWARELYGRSGVDMGGLSPLTYQTIADWAHLTDRMIQPHEVHALMALDSVRRHPPPETTDG